MPVILGSFPVPNRTPLQVVKEQVVGAMTTVNKHLSLLVHEYIDLHEADLAIIDWFLIMGATRRRNIGIAQQIHDSVTQMRS